MSTRRGPSDRPFDARGPSAPGAPRGAKFDRLNALFGGGGGGGAGSASPMPARRGPSFDGMGGRMRREALRVARTVEDITAAADALLQHHELPDEPELLGRMLRHPDAGVGERALAELAALHARGKVQVSGTLREELVAFEPRCREPNARAVLASLLG